AGGTGVGSRVRARRGCGGFAMIGRGKVVHFSWPALVGAMLATALLVAMWQGPQDAARSAVPPPTFAQVAELVRPSVVAVGTYARRDGGNGRYYGTGFVVGDGLTVATNAHVVAAIEKEEGIDGLAVFFPD